MTADVRQSKPRRDTRNGKIKYVRLWVSDLLADTYRLTPAALGAYMRLFAATVLSKAPLRDDVASIVTIARVSKHAWKSIRAELLDAGVIEIIDGNIHDPRALRAIDEFQNRSRVGAENVAERWNVVVLKDAES